MQFLIRIFNVRPGQMIGKTLEVRDKRTQLLMLTHWRGHLWWNACYLIIALNDQNASRIGQISGNPHTVLTNCICGRQWGQDGYITKNHRPENFSSQLIQSNALTVAFKFFFSLLANVARDISLKKIHRQRQNLWNTKNKLDGKRNKIAVVRGDFDKSETMDSFQNTFFTTYE